MEILDSKSFSRKLKDIYAYAQNNNGSLEYTDLKNYFADCNLTQDQTEMLWKYLDSKCIFIQHIDEADSLFSRLPEKERDDQGNIIEEDPKYDPVYHSAFTASTVSDKPAVNGPQDVSNVKQDSYLLASELLRRSIGSDTADEDTIMTCARKLASRLRPNEMHALVMRWGLEAGAPSYTIGQIGSVTGVDPASMEEIEGKAASCTPKTRNGKRRSLFDFFKK